MYSGAIPSRELYRGTYSGAIPSKELCRGTYSGAIPSKELCRGTYSGAISSKELCHGKYSGAISLKELCRGTYSGTISSREFCPCTYSGVIPFNKLRLRTCVNATVSCWNLHIVIIILLIMRQLIISIFYLHLSFIHILNHFIFTQVTIILMIYLTRFLLNESLWAGNVYQQPWGISRSIS